MQNNEKRAKYTFPWLLSVTAKVKVEEAGGLDFDARPLASATSVKVWAAATSLKASCKEENYALSPPFPTKVVRMGGGQN